MTPGDMAQTAADNAKVLLWAVGVPVLKLGAVLLFLGWVVVILRGHLNRIAQRWRVDRFRGSWNGQLGVDPVTGNSYGTMTSEERDRYLDHNPHEAARRSERIRAVSRGWWGESARRRR